MEHTTVMKTEEWFDENGWLLKELPEECVKACHHSGQCDEDVEYWQKKLDFRVPRDKAQEWLRKYGAWTQEELQEKTDEELAQVVLWLACGDIQESGEWFGLV